MSHSPSAHACLAGCHSLFPAYVFSNVLLPSHPWSPLLPAGRGQQCIQGHRHGEAHGPTVWLHHSVGETAGRGPGTSTAQAPAGPANVVFPPNVLHVLLLGLGGHWTTPLDRAAMLCAAPTLPTHPTLCQFIYPAFRPQSTRTPQTPNPPLHLLLAPIHPPHCPPPSAAAGCPGIGSGGCCAHPRGTVHAGRAGRPVCLPGAHHGDEGALRGGGGRGRGAGKSRRALPAQCMKWRHLHPCLRFSTPACAQALATGMPGGPSGVVSQI